MCARARACVLLSSIIDCLLFVTRGAVTRGAVTRGAVTGAGLPGGILGYQIDPNLVSKLLVWYPLFLFGIQQKFGIRCE